ncbi:type II toxin-antitoxin system PemK/MazF family toxin [archaeon]|nr:type II toxin-antitoxin system PemK/MazF family toxin [archaeon]
MESFAKGDVVLFPFPFTNLTNRKLRPSLVLSDEMDEDIILCQITSKYTRKDKFSILLNKNETLNGSLMIDSLIRTNMLFTASKNQIVKKVCKLDKDKYNLVVEKIYQIIKVL